MQNRSINNVKLLQTKPNAISDIKANNLFRKQNPTELVMLYTRIFL